jgi:transcriptional regulator
MYIPANNLMDHPAEILDFITRYSFGTIITNVDSTPMATHLPFHAYMQGDQLYLAAHFARANPQWQSITTESNLVIFTEPHAYISPTHYDAFQSVPTWNYLAVHAYGKARIIEETDKVMALLEAAVKDYEPSYMAQWNQFPAQFKIKMTHGIVAFEIAVTDLQGKQKLSQNKTGEERQRIISTLINSGDTNQVQLGEYMNNNLRDL